MTSSPVAPPPPSDTPIFIAIDIESYGDSMDAHIPAVGIAVGDPTKHSFKSGLISMKRITILPKDPQEEPEPRCKVEFWDKPENKGKLEVFKEDALPYEEGRKAVWEYLQGLYKQYPKVKIWSDNPAFDIGQLSHFLNKNNGPATHSIRYKVDKETGTATYLSVEDVDGYIEMSPIRIREALKRSAPAHNHYPEQDAVHILAHAMPIWRYLKHKEEEAMVSEDIEDGDP